jgi:hypothetical protein
MPTLFLNQLTVSSSVLVEIKAGATVGIGNFLELITLTDACKNKFARSVALYDSGDQIPTGRELAGAPLSCRWSLP